MASIDSLRLSIREMDEPEAMALIMETRSSRATFPARKAPVRKKSDKPTKESKAKARKKKLPSTLAELESVIDSLTVEEIDEVLARLKGVKR